MCVFVNKSSLVLLGMLLTNDILCVVGMQVLDDIQQTGTRFDILKNMSELYRDTCKVKVCHIFVKSPKPTVKLVAFIV